jgi:hypothetical protein
MNNLSRRKFIGLGAATAAGFSSLNFAPSAHAAPTNPIAGSADESTYLESIEKAVDFENSMMDAYATGSTVRLIQSYTDQIGLLSTGFTYDNAVSILAYLVHGSDDSLSRAQILGNGLIHAQETNFPFNDGRFAQGYFVNVADASGAFITPAAAPFFFYTSAVGDQAWAGMALAQLYRRTGNAGYLTAALNVANWIVTNTFNTLGPGGYSYGTNINPSNLSVPSPNGKSTEHNIDTFAFFTMLEELTGNRSAANGASWQSLAQHALSFVIAMYNTTGGFFFTGTLGDQITINPSPVPEDVQSWFYLATLDNRYKQAIDWALANLQSTDTAASKDSSLVGSESFTGMVYDTASLTTTSVDPNAVWLEGTAHTAAALTARALFGMAGIPSAIKDLASALKFIETCRSAQAQLGAGQTVGGKAVAAGEGVVAATSPMDTGFGFDYFPYLHIGATGWYLMAAKGGNPFRLS